MRRRLLLLGLASCAVAALLFAANRQPLQAEQTIITAQQPVAAQQPVSTQQPVVAAQQPRATRRCFTEVADYEQALEGTWQPTGGTSGRHYAQVLGDRDALRRGLVNSAAAQRWGDSACALEDAMHSCYYHGEERAQRLSDREFVPTRCVLAQFDAVALLQSIPNVDLFFVGDSIMRQLWQAIGCHLAKYTVEVEVYWVNQSFSGSGNCPFPNATHCYSFGPDCVRFRLDGTDAKACYIMNHPDMHMDRHLVENLRHLRVSLTSRQVVLFNGGIHFNRGSEARYWDFIQQVRDIATDVTSAGGRFIWLETTPQHFPTDDGSYESSARGGVCRPWRQFRPSWRNEMATVFMQQQGIEVLYTFDNAWSQWDAHVGDTYRNDQLYESGDCSHFCLPGVPDLWAKILFNMLTADLE